MELKEKLDLWVKITGVNPSEEIKNYTFYLDGRCRSLMKMTGSPIMNIKRKRTGEKVYKTTLHTV